MPWTPQDDIALVRIAHPPVNALDDETAADLVRCLREIAASPCRAVVLTGDGIAFSAGADLPRVLREGAAYIDRLGPPVDAAFRDLFAFERPVVAAINGHAIAGGCVLALAADHRVAADGEARIGLAELRVGVPFPASALEIVRHALPPQHLHRLVTGARLHTVAEALAVGFLDEVVEPDALLDRAFEVARRLARVPAGTFAHTKRALRAPALERIERTAEAHDAEAYRLWTSDDVRASIRAFLSETLGVEVP